MTEATTESTSDWAERFPGFDIASQAEHWDDVTAATISRRIHPDPHPSFFTPNELATANALCDQLLATEGDPRVPVVAMIDDRLARNETDGWHHEDMPEDRDAWRRSLAGLDEEAQDRFGSDFAACRATERDVLLRDLHRLGSDQWHGLPAGELWGLWNRYACTAFYSHPMAWNEIGFGGPAYPRGYKNLGVGKREPFEVADVLPSDDPVRETN